APGTARCCVFTRGPTGPPGSERTMQVGVPIKVSILLHYTDTRHEFRVQTNVMEFSLIIMEAFHQVIDRLPIVALTHLETIAQGAAQVFEDRFLRLLGLPLVTHLTKLLLQRTGAQESLTVLLIQAQRPLELGFCG